MKTLEMTDLRRLHYFLGLEVQQENDCVLVSHKRYAEDLLRKSGMFHCKTMASPMNTNDKFSLNDDSGEGDARRYRKLVGSLLYLTHTRPDLIFVVSVVSRYMHQPTKHHLGAVKRILHYVAKTINVGLLYEHTNQLNLTGYTDSDWGGSIDDCKSTSGWFFHLGSTAVTWCSKKQEIMALSSTKAEYISTTSTACQAV